MKSAGSQQKILSATNLNPIQSFKNSLRVDPPWSSIVDFATHKSFCGKRMYPRQLTLLKLIYLETEHMTDYDLEVIGGWMEGFRRREPEGVQPDVWDRVAYLKERGYRWFPHVEAVLGRRASKGLTGGIIGAHQLAYMHSLDNWQDHFGFDPGLEGYLTVVATNQTQAMKFQFQDIRRAIVGCKYFEGSISTNKGDTISIRTKADERALADMVMRKIPIETEIATLKAVAMSSNSASGRGGAGFCMFFDEFAHMITGTGGVRTSEEVYSGYMPSLRQFGRYSLTYIPSSPWTQVGQFFTLYTRGTVLLPEYVAQHGLQFREVTEKDLKVDAEEVLTEMTANPEMLVVQLPSWGLYTDWDRSHELHQDACHPNRRGATFLGPIQWHPEANNSEAESLRREERQNPEKFKVEYRAQFASVIDAYLDPLKIEAMFAQPVDICGDPWREALTPQDYGRFDRIYRAHCDPSTVNANFAMAIAHLENSPPDEHDQVWPHVIFDVLKVWKPEDYPDHTIDYVEIGEELEQYLTKFPTTRKITFDQFNSAALISRLNRRFGPSIRIAELETATEKYNTSRAEKFKSALNLGWVHVPRDNYYRYQETRASLLEMELKFLQYDKGKVVKQSAGPVTTKDLADAVMSVTVDLLHESLDRYSYGRSSVTYGSTDVAGIRSPTHREEERMGLMIPGGRPAFGDDPLRTQRRTDQAQSNRDNIEALRSVRQRSRAGQYVSTTPSRGRGNR